MLQFAARAGLRFIREFNLAACRDFRASWPHQNLAALKTLERLRAFFRFVQESGWMNENPARKVKNPRVTGSPTLPFTREEMTRILVACDDYATKYPKAGTGNAARLRALVLLLRYSGLRIRDAVTLRRDRIADGKLFLYTAKTGTAVYCPLPECVTHALEAIPVTNQQFYFWTGDSDPKSVVGNWQRSLRRVFVLTALQSACPKCKRDTGKACTDGHAEVQPHPERGFHNAHAHRFRDTFAVELLLAGVPLERVSVLLGHQSTRITENHYSPWVRARQEQLEADVQRTWSSDLLAQPKTNGTRRLRGETVRPN
jgi:integrase